MIGIYIILAVIAVAVTWKKGDWKNWREYYPTIIFFIMGDFAYNFMFYNKPLWHYTPPIFNHTLTDFLVAVVIFPCTILLYLSKYPAKLANQVLHVLKWVGIYSLSEWLLHTLGYISYYNGWNLLWTVLFLCIMFPLLRLHYQKPLIVWPVSMILAVVALYIFKIPYDALK